MPRPYFDSEYLYGFHDNGGEHIMYNAGIPGWTLLTRAIGSDPNDRSGENFSAYSDRGGVMVRLNNGHGTAGTIPYENQYAQFAQRCANFVGTSSGARIWIIGNEPNHPIEWPGSDWNWGVRPPVVHNRGQEITPKRYADCYRLVRKAIHALPGRSEDQVLIGAVAPWNIMLTYPGNKNGDWIQYFREVLKYLGPGGCDGVTLHAYTHGANPALVQSEKMVDDARFGQYHWHFRTYRDFMEAIPANMRHLPVYITEANQGDDPWVDVNSGWVQAAYKEIDDWNRSHKQKIRSLLLYRWIGDDWKIDGKSGVIDDFRQALKRGYKWTVEGGGDGEIELWKRLRAVQEKLKALRPQAEEAATLGETLAGYETDLEAAQAPLASAAEVKEHLEDLAAEVNKIEEWVGETDPVCVPQPDIQDVMAGLKQHETERWAVRERDDITRIVLHHTVTRTDITPQRIAEVHVGIGKPSIAYHFLITGDGSIYATQPLDRIVLQHQSSSDNAAANADSVAVALAGWFDANRHVEPSPAQLQAAAALIAWLLDELGLGTVVEQRVFGRRELGEVVGSPGSQWLSGVRYRDKLFAEINQIFADSDCEECEARLQRLQERVRTLTTENVRLQALADQVPGLESKIGELESRIIELEGEIAQVQRELEQCRLNCGSDGSGVVRPEIIDKVGAFEQHPTKKYYNRTEAIEKIVIHHSDSKPHAFPLKALAAIAHYHVDTHGWPGIAYHYVIDANGTIYQTQRHETHSYHCGGANGYTVGICLLGKFMRSQPPERQQPTPKQYESVSRLAAWLMEEFGITDIENVVGHHEVTGTTCPGDQFLVGLKWKQELHEHIQAVRSGKHIPYYLLFWDRGGDHWADKDWRNAQKYIERFRPTTGFSVEDALQARRVIIVGRPGGVSGADEALLTNAGIKVYRLEGADEADTKRMLDELADKGTPWPDASAPEMAAATAKALPSPPGPKEDGWAIPDDEFPPDPDPPPPTRSARFDLVR